MTLNKMMIIGNLGADPELRYTPSGKAVVNLRVAVNDRFRGQDGEWQEETYWFRVEAWEQAAERLAEQLRKGHKVFVEGQLRPREYEGSDGQKRTSLDIRFARVVSLERRDPSEAGYGGGGGGSFSESASPVGPGGDAPVARPRGAAEPQAARSTEAIDVDDIPF
jgi:single-strand DNA-binding protein